MNDLYTIAPIVEGEGEVAALPILLRRIANELFGRYDVSVARPFQVARAGMTRGEALPRAARIQSVRTVDARGLLVVADADDDCAVSLAADLKDRAKPAPAEVVLAVREFEAWFLAAIESLRTHRDVRPDAEYSGDPELRRGAKEALGRCMLRSYRPPLHQPAFARIMDLEQAGTARSFRHLVGCVARLLGEPVPAGPPVS